VRPIPCPSTECRDLLPGYNYLVSVGAGDQYDSHISGKLISFTNHMRIDYFSLFSGAGTVPAPPVTTAFAVHALSRSYDTSVPW